MPKYVINKKKVYSSLHNILCLKDLYVCIYHYVETKYIYTLIYMFNSKLIKQK